MNSDGQIGLAIMRPPASQAKAPYLYFIYHPETMQFVRSANLEHLEEPKFDEKSERVTSLWRKGKMRGRDSFAWQDGVLRLRERIVCAQDSNSYERLTFRWQGTNTRRHRPLLAPLTLKVACTKRGRDLHTACNGNP